jgi:beta-propeller repeat-containing protein
VAFAVLTAVVLTGETRAAARTPAQEQQPALADYGRLPLHFEANLGQTAEQVKFLARGSGYTLFLTSNESVLVLRRPDTAGSVVRVKLLGASPRPAVEGREELPGKSHYFIGSDPRRWQTAIPQYARVEYRDVYPGVSLAYYGNQGQLEYDFVVDASADPGSIRLGIEGAHEISVDDQGDLRMGLEGGEVIERAPVVYQLVDGARKVIDGRFVLKGTNEVAFELGPYRWDRPLVIDPVLVYSTYLGGSGPEFGNAIATDASGNAYVTGNTQSTDFPVANAFQMKNAGSVDAFVTKLNASGSALVYSTYLGGSDNEQPFGIAVDAADNVYVTGGTRSANFPLANPIQSANAGLFDVFVTKLNAAGSALVYSTYVGGSADDIGEGLALDPAANAYVTGDTHSTDFPTEQPVQGQYGGGMSDAFVTNMNASGSAFVYSTYLGGSGDDEGRGIAADAVGRAHVVGLTTSTDFPTANALQPENAGGFDAFVTTLRPTGSFFYSTYLGGSDFDQGGGIALDASGNTYLAGSTRSLDFPTFLPIQPTNRGNGDAFIAKLNAAGSRLLYSTYFGGSGDDRAFAIVERAFKSIYVAGLTTSTDFPTRNPFQAAKGGFSDGFVASFVTSAVGRPVLSYSTYLGGNGDDDVSSLAVDASGNAYVTGPTSSTNFPTAMPFQGANGGGFDAFVSKIGAAEMSEVPPQDR